MTTRAPDGDPRPGDPRPGEEVDPDVNDRLSAINGYGSRRDAERLGSRSLRQDEPGWRDDGAVDEDVAEHEADADDPGDGFASDDNAQARDDDLEDHDTADDLHDEDRAETGQLPESSTGWEGRLRAVDVHHVTFPRASFTRRGYDERSVDEFLSRVESELVWLVEEKADLRDELARLRRQARAAQQAPVPQMEEAQAQAVRLLAKAQQLADSYVAEAEAYSKRTSQEARQHYEDLVAEARKTAAKLVDEARETAATLVAEAEQAAREAAERVDREREALTVEREASTAARHDAAAPPTAVPPPSAELDPRLLERTQAEKRALEEQVAYLRTFSQVTRTQLRAYLEALLSDVEEEWGKADPGVVSSATASDTVAPPLPQQTPGAIRTRRAKASSAPPQRS